MIFLLLSLWIAPSSCAFVDRHEGSVAVVVLPGGAIAELPLASLPEGAREGAWLCPPGASPPAPRVRDRRPLPTLSTLEELSR